MAKPLQPDARLLLAFLGAAVLGIVFWNAWPLYPFKLLTVLMHESGHAAATLLAGGSVDRIAVSPDEAGVTLARYPPGLLREIVIASAGYVGSTVSGCVLLVTAARSRAARLPLLTLAGWCGLVALLYVRDAFTLVFAAGCAVALALLARFGPQLVRRGALIFLAAFSTCYALYDIRADLLHLASGPARTDADALAAVTFVPALAWGLGWGLFSLALVALTLGRLFARGEGAVRSAAAS